MALPALRQDLGLLPAPAADDGSPCWTVHDPAANRYYRIGWVAFEVLSRWHLNSAEAVLAAVNAETGMDLSTDHLAEVADFLARHHLLDPVGPMGLERLVAARKAAHQGWLIWLLHHYLFFRIPLFRPGRILERFSPWVKAVYSRSFAVLMAGILLLGLYGVSRQWDSFTHTFEDYRHWSDLLMVAVALSFAKVLHEFGHAFTAYRYGCRVPSMGVAFLVMWPVLYTDTNEAWKLTSRRQRMAIGAAGMLSELGLAAIATLAWCVLPDGSLRSGLFLLATSSWIITLGINASPFMRFDGYFLLSDWLDMANLHGRSFALARWWLRECLFGLGVPAPETFRPGRQRFLIVFAVTTWLYRLVLFFGIALLVYHLFFKLLGLVLMAVELGWFIFLPMWQEVKVWWKLRASLRWNRASRRTLLVLGGLVLFVIVPWQQQVRAQAVMGAAEAQGIYAVSAALVKSAPLPVGRRAKAGEVLVELEAPEMQRRLKATRVREQALRRQVMQQPFDENLRRGGEALRQRWQEARAAADGLAAEVAQLTVRAPFAGRIAEANDSLVPGAWVAQREKLFIVVGTHGARGEAWVDEQTKDRIEAGGRATFVADLAEVAAIDCRIAEIDRLAVAELDLPYGASVYGGLIAVQKDRQSGLVPLDPVFRVRLDQCDTDASPSMELRGVVVLRGERRSVAGRALRQLSTVLRREAGF